MMKDTPPSSRREALLVEAVPLFGGLLGVVVVSIAAQLSLGESGEPVSAPELLITGPLAIASLAAGLLFAAAGIGWIIAGRLWVGMTVFIARFFVALWVYAWVIGGTDGSSATDPVSNTEALIAFLIATVTSAASVLALAYLTRVRGSSS